MTMTRMLLINICFCAMLVGLVNSQCKMDRSFLGEALDNERFQGKWYMTSWYYHGTGKSKAPMLENVQSLYSLTSDGNWNITYGVGVLEGLCFKNPVEAMVDKTSDRRMWVLNFHLHKIMATDYNDYAVLHQCLDGMEFCSMDSTEIAVLSRTPQATTASQDAVEKAVRNACVDVKDLITVEQLENCLCENDVRYGLVDSCDLESM